MIVEGALFIFSVHVMEKTWGVMIQSVIIMSMNIIYLGNIHELMP